MNPKPLPPVIRAVHQFHSGSAYGDAITNGMLITRGLLQRMGFSSEIYVEHVAPELQDILKPHTKLIPSEDTYILFHHSMGHNLDAFVASFAGHGALVYHNITPSKFFLNNPHIQRYIEKGLSQLDDFSHHFSAALADSSFNAQDLTVCGYQKVDVLPLLFDLEKLQNRPWNDALVQSNAAIPTILFVGRIAPNKRPHELVEIVAELRHMIDGPFQMVLVGGFDPNDSYCLEIRDCVSRQGLEDYFRFTGKASDEDLAGWYRAADIFITLSEHEGFCVPLIEAMVNDIPVIAFDAGAVRETMGGEGFLLRRKDPAEIAALCKLLLVDRPLRRCVIRGQRARLKEFENERVYNRLAEFLRCQGLSILAASTEPSTAHVPLQYQVEGPFETSYSLALVNREIAKALEDMFPRQVGVFATEGPGDYLPDMSMVNNLPGLPALASRGYKGAHPDVCIRNLYPPRVADMDGLFNFLYFAWEETGLSTDWVSKFNRSLDGMPVLSEFVRKVLIDNGVCVPSIAAGCGVDHITHVHGTGVPAELNNIPQDCFVLLHVSSCFARKGIDLLFEAYGRAMTLADDVVLIIKTFPNPHNDVEEKLHQRQANNPDYPKVVIINRDIPAGEMVSLYQCASALVAPTRGEGFGLPMAEAMAFDVPVITTGYGGQSDFCTPETAWLIDYRFAPAETHMGLYNSLWVEPDIDHLTQLVKKIVATPRTGLADQIDRARALVASRFTWAACAERVNVLLTNVASIPPLASKKIKVAWMTSWNTKCGIAEYSSHLLAASMTDQNFETFILAQNASELNQPDGTNVYRCWENLLAPIDQLLAKIAEITPDVIVIQFNFGFISMNDLTRLLSHCEKTGIVTLVELHATKDVFHGDTSISLRSAQAGLARASRILAHSLDDVNRLKEMGLVENVCLFPHGVLDWKPSMDGASMIKRSMGMNEDAFIIASFGFLLPHKGLAELIEAFEAVRCKRPNARLVMVNALYPHPISSDLHEQLKASIACHAFSHEITLLTDFLEDEESLALLHRADVIVFPYQTTAESASGAVRHGLVAGKPVLCTPLPIFAELSAAVHYTGGTTPRDIADSLVDLIDHPNILDDKINAQQQWLTAHRYSQIGQRLGGMIRGILINKQFSL